MRCTKSTTVVLGIAAAFTKVIVATLSPLALSG